MNEEMESTSEIEVLFPERTLTIGAEPVVLREFSFLEGMRLNSVAAPLIAELAPLFEAGGTASLTALIGVLCRHPEIVCELIAVAIDRSPDWLQRQALSDREGQFLLHQFWQVNRDFFIARLGLLRAEQMLQPARNSTPNGSGAASPPNHDAA